MTSSPIIAAATNPLDGLDGLDPLTAAQSALAMALGLIAVAALWWFVASRVKKRARAAVGMVWMVVAVGFVGAFFLAAVVDALVGGPSAVEAALLGWVPGLGLLLPLGATPAVGVAVYLGVLTPLYALAVWLVWWGLVSGAHVGEPDRAQSKRWLYALSGRGPDGKLHAGFVRWFRPLVGLVALLLLTALVQALFAPHPPHPAAVVVGGFFVTGAFLNLRETGPAVVAPLAEEDDAFNDAPEAASSEPPPSWRDALAAAGLGELPGATPASTLPALAARTDPDALAGAHPVVVALGAPFAYQADLLRRTRAASAATLAPQPAAAPAASGAGLLVVGGDGTGRTSSLVRVALDLALGQLAQALVVAPSHAAALAFGGRLRDALGRGPTPDLVRVAAGLAELAAERQQGHDPVIYVTTPEELRAELVARASLRPAFFLGLGAVLVDDLDLLTPAQGTALRLALDELRVCVAEARGLDDGTGGAPARLVVLATAREVGAGLDAWASDLLGERTQRLEVDGAPAPPCEVAVVDALGLAAAATEAAPASSPPDAAEPPSTPALAGALSPAAVLAPVPAALPAAVIDALAAAGHRVHVVDAVHGSSAGSVSWAPAPCWDLAPASAPDSDRGGLAATLVLARRADVDLVVARHRPRGAASGPPVPLVVAVVDADRVTATGLAAAGAVLRALPVGLRVAGVARRHLSECLVRPRRVDWLERTFGAGPVAVVGALVGARAGVEAREVVVLEGEPPELVPWSVWVAPAGLELARAFGAEARPVVRLVSAADGEAVCELEAGVAEAMALPRAAFVAGGRRWELAGEASGARRVASPTAWPGVVRRRAQVTVTPATASADVAPEVRLSFTDAATPMAISARSVHVAEEVVGLVRVSPTGAVEGREDLAAPRRATYRTAAVRVSLPLALDEPSALALALAVRVALGVMTTLSEDALLVDVAAAYTDAEAGAEARAEADGTTLLWIAERADEGGTAIPWLLDRVVVTRPFWQVVAAHLVSAPTASHLRTDASTTEPDPASARATLAPLLPT